MAKNDYNHLGTWLPAQLKRKGITAEKLGQKIGLSRTAIYRWMYDQDRPSEQHMLKVCRILGVSFEEGLRQYTPRPTGRPKGSKSETTREVRTRSR